MLEVRDLHAGYGRVPVLHDISRSTVRPGEVVLVLGRNGAGKSTLLRSIAGFITPDARTRDARRAGTSRGSRRKSTRARACA